MIASRMIATLSSKIARLLRNMAVGSSNIAIAQTNIVVFMMGKPRVKMDSEGLPLTKGDREGKIYATKITLSVLSLSISPISLRLMNNFSG